MSIKKLKINDFSKGMQPTQRHTDVGAASLVKNFDISTDNQKIKPLPSMVKWMTTAEEDYNIVGLGGITQGSDVVIGSGRAINNWLGVSWDKRIKIEPATAQSDTADYCHYDLADLGATFWDNVKSDGSDIRITDAEHRALDYYIYNFDNSLGTGNLLFNSGGDVGAYYIYFDNADAEDASNLPGIFDELVDSAYPLDTNDQDYAGVFDLDDGAAFVASPETNKFGDGLRQLVRMQTVDGGGFYDGSASISFLIKVGTAPVSDEEFVHTSGSHCDLTLKSTGVLSLFTDNVTGGTTTNDGSVVITNDEWRYVTFGYSEDREEKFIYVDGTSDVSVTGTFNGFDEDPLENFYLENPVSDSTIEFVVIQKGTAKPFSQHDMEQEMYLDSVNFWNDSAMETQSSVTFTYAGVQLWQKGLEDSEWSEYLVNGLPVKDYDLHPTSAYLVYSQGHVYTLVSGTGTNDFSGDVYLAKLGFGTVNWREESPFISSTQLPQASYGVDKAFYLGNATFDKLEGETFTEGVFTPYSTANHSIQFGQYQAIALDRGNQSYMQLWDLDSTTAREFVDFGVGEMRALGAVYGSIFGVVNNNLDNEALANGRESLDIRLWSGGAYARPFLSFESPTSLESEVTLAQVGSVLNKTESIRNGMTFWAKLYDAFGVLQEGLWSLTRNEKNGEYAMALHSDTTAMGDVVNVYRTGNVLITTNNDGVVYKVDKDDFSIDSVWQSIWLGGSDIDEEDKTLSVELTTEPLKSGQAYVVKYKKPGEAWVTIATFDDVGAIHREIKLVEPTNKQLPTFNETMLRISSTGGDAGLTGVYITIENKLDK